MGNANFIDDRIVGTFRIQSEGCTYTNPKNIICDNENEFDIHYVTNVDNDIKILEDSEKTAKNMLEDNKKMEEKMKKINESCKEFDDEVSRMTKNRIETEILCERINCKLITYKIAQQIAFDKCVIYAHKKIDLIVIVGDFIELVYNERNICCKMELDINDDQKVPNNVLYDKNEEIMIINFGTLLYFLEFSKERLKNSIKFVNQMYYKPKFISNGKIYCEIIDVNNKKMNIGSIEIKKLRLGLIEFKSEKEFDNILLLNKKDNYIYCLDSQFVLKKYNKYHTLISNVKLNEIKNCFCLSYSESCKGPVIYYINNELTENEASLLYLNGNINKKKITKIDLSEINIAQKIQNIQEIDRKKLCNVFIDNKHVAKRYMYVRILLKRIKGKYENELGQKIPIEIMKHIFSYL